MAGALRAELCWQRPRLVARAKLVLTPSRAFAAAYLVVFMLALAYVLR